MSTTKEAQVLIAARDALVKVASERDNYKAKYENEQAKTAMIRTRLECEKVAAEMHEKGLNLDVEFPELVDSLEKAASDGRLPVIKEAVDMSAPNMGTKIAHINHDETSGAGASDLERFLVGQIG